MVNFQHVAMVVSNADLEEIKKKYKIVWGDYVKFHPNHFDRWLKFHDPQPVDWHLLIRHSDKSTAHHELGCYTTKAQAEYTARVYLRDFVPEDINTRLGECQFGCKEVEST
jgi:hypothetical protein